MDYKLVVVFVFFLFGVTFLGKGITGFVVISQTCCSPVDEYCDEDAICGHNLDESSTDMIDLISGFTLLFAGYFVWRYKEH